MVTVSVDEVEPEARVVRFAMVVPDDGGRMSKKAVWTAFS